MAEAPRTKVLVAVGPDKSQRMQRILSGHDVTRVETCDEARTLLEAQEVPKAGRLLGEPRRRSSDRRH